MGGSPLFSSIQLRETIPGHCPVCGDNWSADPDCHCACTRPREGDEAEIAKAYLLSAACRSAKFRADRLESQSNVVPIRQPLRGSRRSHNFA